MSHLLFLSHDHRDSAVATTVASLISRITLDQLRVWHSSDPAGEGGIRPGKVWLDEIRTKLRESRAVITLLTPNSLSKPWLLFESGFGAANDQCEVVPICIGIDRMDTVPFPLAMYQCYLLSDYESLKAFCIKLLRRYEIPFDEEMAKPIVQKSIGELVKIHWPSEADTELTATDLASVRDAIKDHIDRRLLDFFNKTPDRTQLDGKKSEFVSYLVPLVLEFPGLSTTHHLEIKEFTTISHITDSVCAMIYHHVGNYSYLVKWILRESTSGRNLVIREFQAKIAAHPIFRPGTNWVARPLSRPYCGTDSAVEQLRRDH